MLAVSVPATSMKTYEPSMIETISGIRRHGFLGFLHRAWMSHGDLFRVKIGSNTITVVVHPEHVARVTITEREKYSKVDSYQNLRDYLLGDGIVTAVGDSWKRQRRMMQPLFTPKSVEQFFGVFLSDTEVLLKRWATDHVPRGRPVEMLNEMMQVTAAVILHSVFSTESDRSVLAVKNDIELMISRITKLTMSPLHLPMWVPSPVNLRFRRARRRVDSYINEIIARRRRLPAGEWPDDLLTKLMTHQDETGAPLNEELLRKNGIAMFAAGHETTARTLSFLFYALSQHPDVERKLHAELDSVLGDAPPTLAQLRKLPFTLRCVKETLRLYPAAPMYARDAVADDEFDGAHIPSGSRVVIVDYFTHRHPEFWDAPEQFDPDRWAPELEAKRHPQAFHAFSLGPRMCLGSNFSLLESHVMVAMIAKRFRLRMKTGHVPDIDMFGTLGSRNGLPMHIEAR